MNFYILMSNLKQQVAELEAKVYGLTLQKPKILIKDTIDDTEKVSLSGKRTMKYFSITETKQCTSVKLTLKIKMYTLLFFVNIHHFVESSIYSNRIVCSIS